MMPFNITECRVQSADCGSLQTSDFRLSEPEPLAIVTPCLNPLAPVSMVEVPLDRLAQTGIERALRRPAELTSNLGRVDRIAPIVARAIGHERLQAGVRRVLRSELVEHR